MSIPESIILQCPKNRFQGYVRAQACESCEFFGGLQELNPDTRIPWQQRHKVICTMPVARTLDTLTE